MPSDSGRETLTCFIACAADGWFYARTLANLLRQSGLIVLHDDGARLEDEWVLDLRISFQRADALIILLTDGATASKFFHEEMQHFLLQGCPVFPIVFGAGIGLVPMELRHYLVLSEPPEALSDGPSEGVVNRIFPFITRAVEVAKFRNTLSSTPLAEFASQSAGRKLNEGKLILVGRGGVGKTSLVRRLINDDFDPRESKTEGIKIDVWQVPVGAEEVRLNVWDFGGQEIMHATHQFFLTEKSIYLLVLNGREGREDTDAEYWLRHIQSFGGDSPVIVVQNKTGEHPFDLNYRGLQARYPQIRGFIKTDCENGSGIANVRDQIRTVIEQIPDIRMKLPADWYAIKERLEAIDADFMGYDAFREICTKEGVTGESDRNALAFVLHCLGIALNYRSDPRLRETSILKPEWVTEGIYKVLNAQKLAHRQGELRLTDLADLLPAKRYPVERHAFLLELMRKFSLCFAFPDSQDRYLVPDLLGKEEPEDASAFAPKACLNFEYQYDVLPEGLLPRFIVRSHTLSRDQPRWRSGVVLAREGCRALVTSNPLERRIVVRVLGANARARRELLAIIRYDFDRINAEFKDSLGATARVPLLQHPMHSVEYTKLVAFERQGVREFPEYIDGRVIKVAIDELLNGVDLEANRSRATEMVTGMPLIFFSYAHEDEALRDELETHLKLLQRQQVIASWHDRKILPGGEWDREIDRQLEAARIILLLVSADFLASDYCWEKEVARAIERHDKGDAKVVPVILRSCDWEGTPFAKIEGLPEDMKPIKAWPDRDSAWTNVAKGIRKLAQSMAHDS